MDEANERRVAGRPVDRRTMLKGIGAGALAVGAGQVVSQLAFAKPAFGATSSVPIKIGYVSPKTGAFADFSISDSYVLKKIRASSAYAKGITVGGKHYSIQIIPVDTQSDPARAATAAQQLIQQQKVDLILTTSTPETTNPVAGAAQQFQTPCLATVVPWEAWYGGLGGNPGNPTTNYSYNAMFFFGLKEFAGTFIPMWKRIESKTHAPKVLAGMFPNDADGNAFRGGFPSYAQKAGYTFVDGGAYTDGTTDYSAMIEKFKAAGAEFFVNCPIPPDFNTFWKQAAQANFRPKLATVAKVMLFPSDAVALGNLSNNIATDAWWTPYAPYKSSLTGESASQLASDFEHSTGNQWVDSLGSSYSLFEVAIEALKASDDPHDHAQVASKLQKVHYSGISGPINFGAGPAPGVGIVKPVGVQWKPGKKLFGKKFPWQEFVVDNSLNKDVPINGDLVATNT
jgi:branched-chain amino acid transport system substrate-binding protein